MSLVKESIFAHSLALHQSGRLKNTVYAKDREVFIFNIDKTVLLNFLMPSKEKPIASEISFQGADYDSDNFVEQNGRIIFTTKEGSYVKTKSCSAPEKTFSDMQNLWDRYVDDDNHPNEIKFNKNVLGLLDESLSHIEILSKDKAPMLIQRDIYTGSIITITKDESGGLGMASTDNVVQDFEPIGIRTNDFFALFSFCDNVTFFLGNAPFVFVEGDMWNMQGVISRCMYDELGNIEISKGEADGRQITEKRNGIKETGQTAGEGSKKKKRRRC